ncbi:uncharacterized protein K452DRAFT_363064 [Aplosporella prunicola CBS 121167]|uniref:Zn(2)-C6 fungal-type domain-containing protein n=1 Tax=Aplosporella prunicola CBS 121167 TaxID=1176127 RepID=A0A6A6AYM0_9PEZI|nr:uncharacterized protein K452DRAFT_363064 [Aplosporella prunicola CBS 121167]KAF2135601.1 hypothetical protein K452DRAFT_363064 [Aplosporella prunicola CBS 121167]
MDVSAPTPVPRKVPSACQRCRRQKLKCDIQRPCSLCVRAGVECSAAENSSIWKPQFPCQPSQGNRSRKRTATAAQHAQKRVRRAVPVRNNTAGVAPPVPDPEPEPESSLQRQISPVEDDSAGGPEHSPDPGPAGSTSVGNVTEQRPPSVSAIPDVSWISSSAAIDFAEEAFHQHETAALEESETSAFSACQWAQARPADRGNFPVLAQTLSLGSPSMARSIKSSKRAEVELMSIIPALEPATLLVNNYFDRIHWFMLVFHQTDFIEGFHQLYTRLGHHPTEMNVRLGFLSVFTSVCIVSLRYTNAEQRATLAGYGVHPDNLQDRLLTALRLRLFDVVSLGSIEAIQTCVLLGSFFLYHGEPELAWPICGCGLRIAQALNLHRQKSARSSASPDLDDPVQRAEETRKRCWWAVYEIETFCSMLYGFPLSISDDDCDVQHIDPYPVRSKDPTWESATWRATGQATLLSYKFSMVQLSTIVKSALTDLYGLRQSLPGKGSAIRNDGSRLQNLIAGVNRLDSRLQQWYTSLPKQLQSEKNEVPAPAQGSNPAASMQRHLFQLQALALKLAFENARILVHRPLLSYKMVASHGIPEGQSSSATSPPDPFRVSTVICRDAALQIAKVGSTQVFKDAADTYAVSFISLHLFTAGVTLSIMTSPDPLSQASHESKLGIRRLMEMQSRLKSKSIVAEQGLGILKKLMSLVLLKEKEKMFEFPEGPVDEERGREPANSRSGFETMSIAEADSHGAGSGQSAVMPERPADQNSQQTVEIRPSGVEPMQPATTSNTEELPFDFCEDPIMAQALIDFEQAMTNVPDASSGDVFLSFNDEFSAESCFSGQDQSWIWGTNLYS